MLSALRVYALCGRSILLATLVGVLSTVPVGTNAVRFQQRLYLVYPLTCIQWAAARTAFSWDPLARGCLELLNASDRAILMCVIVFTV